MSETPTSLPRRRNGKPQACEPCRKRKMACDHTLPVCRRCIQRKTTAACVYLPAPMTQKVPKGSKSTGVDSADQPMSLSLPVLNIALTGLERTHSVDTPESQTSNPGLDSQGSHSHVSPILTHSRGFLGPTSFSAVFLENQQNLETALPSGTGLPGDQVLDQLQSQSRHIDSSLDTRMIQLGTKVLSHLPDRETCLALLNSQRLKDYLWMPLATKHCIEALWSTYRTELSKLNGTTGLESLARVLVRNSKIHLEEPDDGQAWLQSFSGYQMRWESLGIIFASCCHGILSSPEHDGTFKQPNGQTRNVAEFLEQMREAMSLCVSLCSTMDMVNPIMAVLFYLNSVLHSILGAGGDTSLLLWRQHADLVAVCTALGLHRDPDHYGLTVSIRIELRRRLHACIFHNDKTLASFTGRPPFLSRRYTSCKMPLDISDEDLLLPQSELAQVAARLDENGWNLANKLNPTTVVRMFFQTALIRDEILGAFLGLSQAGLGSAEIKALKDRADQMYNSLPPLTVYHPSDESATAINNEILWIKICGRLRHLQNHFLLERMAIKHTHKNGQELLEVSKETMSLILMTWTHRDRFVGQHSSYEWIILCFGVPASGVLCVELLKHSANLALASVPPSSQPRLPLSETVQMLSLFAAFLGWVPRSLPNYELCNRIRGIILRLLDQTLDGPSNSQRGISSSQRSGGGGAGEFGSSQSGKGDGGFGVGNWVGDGGFDGVWPGDFLDFDFMSQGGEDWNMLDSSGYGEWTAPWVGLG